MDHPLNGYSKPYRAEVTASLTPAELQHHRQMLPMPTTSRPSTSASGGGLKKAFAALGLKRSTNKKERSTSEDRPVYQTSSHARSASSLVIQSPAQEEYPRPVHTAAVTSAPAQPLPALAPLEVKKKTMVQQVVAKSKKAVAAVRQRLTSKTPKDQWPTTWDDYAALYAKNQIDLDDPCDPPIRDTTDLPEAAELTPYEQRVFIAPLPPNEAERQAVVNKLDLFGARRKASNLVIDTVAAARPLDGDSMPPPGSPRESVRTVEVQESVDSMENHPAFRAIVQKCRDLFDTKVGLITVLDEEKQLFLASGGLPQGIDVLPRSVSLCSHTILSDEESRGLVVLDSTKDWRFANNKFSTKLGARFYAGVPLLAPTFGDPSAPSVALGALCVIDDKPHTSFTEEQREALRELARQASLVVEDWVNSRMGSKLEKLEESYQSLQQLDTVSIAETFASSPPVAAAASPSIDVRLPVDDIVAPLPTSSIMSKGPSSSSRRSSASDASGSRSPPPRRPSATALSMAPSPFPPHMVLPATPPDSLHRQDSTASACGSDTVSISSSRREAEWSQLASPAPTSSSSSPSTHGGHPLSSSRPAAGKLALQVTSEEPVGAISKDLHKIFDTATKMLARALDLNLVYLVALDLASSSSSSSSSAVPKLTLLSAYGLSNPPPSFDPSLHFKALRAPEGGLLYRSPHSDATRRTMGGYASGILIPVIEVRRVGYVLCGFTGNGEREFDDTDMQYFVRFAEQLESHVTKIGRS